MSYTIVFKIWTVLAGITFSTCLMAQPGGLQFDRIDIADGLSNNQVNAVIKDERGFIWFGTMSGINRYDGYTFKTFRHKNGDSASISDDYISRIAKGPGHTLWVLTRNGWNIYDPLTEKFTVHLQAFLQTIHIPNELFSAVVEDKKGDFWFVAPGIGLYRYSPASDKTDFFNSSKAGLLYSNNVIALTADGTGALWIAYTDGVLEKMEPAAKKIVFRTKALQLYAGGQPQNYRLFADSGNDLWLYCEGAAKGIWYFKPASGTLVPVNKDTKGLRLNNDVINGIIEDSKGDIWVATDHGGINVINKKGASVAYIINTEHDDKSLSQNSITALYKDNSGIIWAGTFKKGANRFHEGINKFPLYQHNPLNPRSLIYNDVNTFAEDTLGNLWIGTNGGGLIYFNRAAGTYRQYLHDPADASSLSNNVIVSLWLDHRQKLWIGTYYGGLDCFDGRRFVNYKHNDKNPASLADDRVWEIFEDSRQQLWVGTLMEGLDLFDQAAGRFIHYKPGTGNALQSGYIASIIEDKKGSLWLGTAVGIDVLARHTGLFHHFEHRENDRTSLSQNNVNQILQDSRGLIWVATRDGLNLFDPVRQEFKTYRVEDGLPGNSIATIGEDNNHNLWLGTPNGLSNAIVSVTADQKIILHFKNYDESDGLQGREFNENAVLKTRKGEMIFGGANGLNIFQPPATRAERSNPGLVLTDLQVFNHSIKAGEIYNGRMVLPQSITEAKEIVLPYNQNVFTVEFAATGLFNADKIKYSYKLEGFSGEWLITGSHNRKATFTNLDPGAYVLKIRAGNEDGTWSNKELFLTIRILPPFWRTPVAYFVYALLIIGGLAYSRTSTLRKIKLKFRLEQERQEAQRLHELDRMKIKFFTNVSHEFRTPLSLIITPLEKLIAQAAGNDRSQLRLIHRNARRLLHLVNQLLDFRKLEEQELRLNKTPGDIIHFIREVSYSFSDVALNRQISFSVHSSEAQALTGFDHDKLERVLFNLLSNAFKFTPPGGIINVFADVVSGQPGPVLQLRVMDTGIGIEKGKQEKIFERFFQNDIPGSMVNQGSGIGLAITKEFVKLHNGTITVESELSKGSCFTVIWPIEALAEEGTGRLEEPVPEENPGPAPVETQLHPVLTAGSRAGNKKKTLLLVEDNDDFRFYIKDNLKVFYTVLEAENGKSGWQKTLSEHPDLVISDISMPEMSGIDLCRKIKGDKRTSFIPVILLTALAGEEQQLAGLQTGASDYLTKPFNFEILLSKVGNLLSEKEAFKKTYQKQVAVKVTDVEANTADERFVQQALAIVEQNISNPGFSVEELSRQLFMGRVALYRRLFQLTGKTPIEFIRSNRLQRAVQLLQKTRMTVAEVAYEVGFNNPKYFTKYFKAEFNDLPSSYQGGKKKDAAEE